MNLLLYPLAAVAGGVIGVLAHEALHYLAASVFGSVEAVGWQGGVLGGPFVDFRAPRRLYSEAIRKAPLIAGVAATSVVVGMFDGVTVVWLLGAGIAAGLLWTSPEDLSLAAAEQPEAEA
jgi:hypothetical protein